MTSLWRRWFADSGAALVRFATFVLIVTVIALALLAWQVESRTRAIGEIHDAATRIEQAAVHTEEVLVEVVERQGSPEAVNRNRAIIRALEDIASVKRMLCRLPELSVDPACSDT